MIFDDRDQVIEGFKKKGLPVTDVKTLSQENNVIAKNKLK
jgi:hypothetical protein